MQHVISTAWNGKALPRERWVFVDLAWSGGNLAVDVDSPFYGNPAPAGPAGPTEGLWEFEVVELFLLGGGCRYLEVELGPHGHYLALFLEGTRNITRRMLPLEYAARISGSRWRGAALIPENYIPEGAFSGNAYAIYGRAGKRRHLALYPLSGGDVPDFHRLEDFGPLPAIRRPSP